MVSVKKYCKRYSDVVPIEHTFKKHMLMVCPYADYDHKINPIGYKFPESGLKNISYYRNCDDVDHYDPLFGDIDFMDEIMYLDYKLIDKALNNPNTMNFLLAFINNKQSLKVLHLVNLLNYIYIYVTKLKQQTFLYVTLLGYFKPYLVYYK